VLKACKNKLSSAKVPRFILFAGEIPKTAYGKIDRRAAQKLADALRREAQ
jgi:acyl-coenzyme A synthetase/AMP-(fatty) acid ligase